MSFSRREMIKGSAACAMLGASSLAQANSTTTMRRSDETAAVPAHLQDYASLFEQDPQAASAKWFKKAKYGLLFITESTA